MKSTFSRDQKHKLIDREILAIEIKNCKRKKAIIRAFNQMISLLEHNHLPKQGHLSKI